MKGSIFYAVLGISLLLFAPAHAQNIQYAGSDAELTISRVSDQTIEVLLSPIASGGSATKPPESTVLIDYPKRILWNGRTLSGKVERTLGNLRIEITPDPLTVTIRRDGDIVQRLSWPGDNGNLEFRTEAPVFGLGQGGPQFDRRGHRLPMRDGWGTYKRPTHGSRTSAPFLMGMEGWSMFVHHPISRDNVFDLRSGEGLFEPDQEMLNQPMKVLLTAWEEPADILSEYTRYAGKSPIPPKWSLGYMQSHRTLEGPEQVREVARTFREKNLPADAVIYLGTGFTPAGWNRGHGSFEFNDEIFPQPQQLVNDMHDLNFNVVLHTYGAPDGLHGTSLDAPGNEENHIASHWAEHRPISEMGIDGWWPDGAEGLDSEGRLARHRMYWLGPQSDHPNQRPWSLHRTGYSGVHRYGSWMWSGDPDSFWSTLETQIAVGLNHTVSLTPFWGSDTGGFLPSTELTGELYIRWFQFSAFCSSFRSHGRAWHLRLPWGWNTAELGPPEVDAFSDAFENGYSNPNELRNGLVEPIARQYLQLRYQLLPYNYTLFRQTHDTGLPPMRTMWLHYPDDAEAVRQDDQYLWGRDLLVAPVYTKGADDRSIYLPEGMWYDFWTNELHEGGERISRQVDLATLPLFVRAGAIIPMDPVRQFTAQQVDEPTTLRIYPGTDGEFRWYQDDGQSMDYQDGEYSWTLLKWDDSSQTLTIAPDPDSDGQAPSPAEFRIRLMNSDAVQMVSWDGSHTEVSFESASD